MNLPFNNPPDSEGTGGTTDTAEETFELLNAEETLEDEKPLELSTDEKPKTDEVEIKDTEKEDEIDELAELEEELKPPTEEDLLELTTPVRRKEILAKYPKLFKDFPYLEKAYYREQQFTETFPTIQDAKVAAEKAQILDQTERDVMSGDIGSILRAVKEEDQDAFFKIADNYLPTLRKVDQNAYYHVLGNVIKDTIVTMVKEGRALGDQGAPLQAAANILNQFVFGSQNFTPAQNLSKQVNPQEQTAEQEITKQRQQLAFQKFESVKDDLQTRADNVLKSTIDGHIDPNGTMTDYVKQHATREAFDNLENLINKDTRFRSLLDKLWEKAFQSNFDRASTDRIKSAYLSKAKTLLPSVIKKARNDAMKGRRESSQEETTTRKSPITRNGISTTPSSGKFKKAADIPKNMSTLDVLMKD